MHPIAAQSVLYNAHPQGGSIAFSNVRVSVPLVRLRMSVEPLHEGHRQLLVAHPVLPEGNRQGAASKRGRLGDRRPDSTAPALGCLHQPRADAGATALGGRRQVVDPQTRLLLAPPTPRPTGLQQARRQRPHHFAFDLRDQPQLALIEIMRAAFVVIARYIGVDPRERRPRRRVAPRGR